MRIGSETIHKDFRKKPDGGEKIAPSSLSVEGNDGSDDERISVNKIKHKK